MEQLKVYFDPRCPWCFLTSSWARRLEELGLVELDWGLYCLEVLNLPEGADPVTAGEGFMSGPSLRVAWEIMQREDSKAMGRYYKALGQRTWLTEGAPLTLDQCIRESAVEAGFPESIVDDALSSEKSWLGVLSEHDKVISEKRAIGVPTIALDSGDGPHIFGPVISFIPEDDDTVALWEHTRWLMRYANFAELKRGRFSIPQLPNRTLWERREGFLPSAQ